MLHFFSLGIFSSILYFFLLWLLLHSGTSARQIFGLLTTSIDWLYVPNLGIFSLLSCASPTWYSARSVWFFTHPLSFYFTVYLFSFIVYFLFCVWHYILQMFVNLSDNLCYLKKTCLELYPWPVLFIFPGIFLLCYYFSSNVWWSVILY